MQTRQGHGGLSGRKSSSGLIGRVTSVFQRVGSTHGTFPTNSIIDLHAAHYLSHYEYSVYGFPPIQFQYAFKCNVFNAGILQEPTIFSLCFSRWLPESLNP